MAQDPDDDDEVVGFGAPLPPDDRLWRHPSELGAVGAGGVAPPPARRTGRGSLIAVALVAAVAGGAVTGGALAVTGNLDQDGDRLVTERVALTPVVSSPLVADEQSVAALTEHVGPAVVRLEVATADDEAEISGVVFRDDGLVLTTASPFDRTATIEVVAADGQRYAGRLLGADTVTDIAVVAVLDADLPVAVLATEPELEVGSPTVALGAAERPDGHPAVSTGVVRTLNRRLDVDGRTLHGLIETDAPLDPASSGGPLLDHTGAVVGIATGLSEPDASVGHATPIRLARRVADHLLQTGAMPHAWLGIESQDQAAVTDDTTVVEGAVVRAVGAGSPAEAGGLAEGDVIIELDGSPIGSSSELVVALREHEPGDEVVVTYWRDGGEHEVAVTCGER